ncbi:hypothetical protein THAOC_37167 [Thalassiosira oceanica]|uniref:Uncharacterized protein n=1 Tax=Thalassiosira oceanica TaxID=159749 RepID=K0QYP7_THAOC|nr:hypothetical protein THAOC_37167 [Thalassiosira oceanica]|eukprot:EJK44303.1 hypothetical protein THAOC_37167 [Thalassiosira oceanica]
MRRALERRRTAEASISRPGTARHLVLAGLRWFRVDFAAVPLASAAFQTSPRLGIRLASLAKTSDGGGIDIEARNGSAFGFGGATLVSSRFCSGSASFGCISNLATARHSFGEPCKDVGRRRHRYRGPERLGIWFWRGYAGFESDPLAWAPFQIPPRVGDQ